MECEDCLPRRFAVAEKQLALGLNVVVDCPLARPQLYLRAQAIAQRHGALVAVVECSCSDDEVWRERLERRAGLDAGSNRSHKPASWGQLQALLLGYQGCWNWSTDGSVAMPTCHISLDTGGACSVEAVSELANTIALPALLGYLARHQPNVTPHN